LPSSSIVHETNWNWIRATYSGEAMKKTAVFASVVSVLGLTVPLVSGLDGPTKQDKPAKPIKVDTKVGALMQEKLKHSQKVLEGIALNDFDIIAKNAQSLLALSEKAEWKVFPTPPYLMYSNEFQRAAEKLIKDAKDKNLDGATLAYMEMTLNCVRCHKYVRSVRMTRGETENRWLAQQ
jgi:hypothetical protein